MILLLLACTMDNELNQGNDNTEPIDPTVEPLRPWAIAGPGDLVKRWEFLSLNGGESYDPDDEAAELLYYWFTIDSPTGSQPTLVDEFTAAPSFGADLLGTYTVALVVTDLDDLESGNDAWTRIEVIPYQDLQVTLEWKQSDFDFDLHLVRDNGEYFGEGDCFFGDPEPDWGLPGSLADNPWLDTDSEGSSWTETITLDQPEERDYEVYVTLWSRRGSEAPSDQPKLTIQGEASPVFDDAGPTMTEGQVWHAGTIHWPSLSFTIVDELTTHDAMGGPAYND